jgi:hypothetical protein
LPAPRLGGHSLLPFRAQIWRMPNPGRFSLHESRKFCLHVCKKPVADVIDAKLTVIDVAVLGATLLGGENLDVCSVIVWFPSRQRPATFSCKFVLAAFRSDRASTHTRPAPTRAEIVASVKHARATPKRLRCLLFPVPLSRYPAAPGFASERGRSSVVERQLPKLAARQSSQRAFRQILVSYPY